MREELLQLGKDEPVSRRDVLPSVDQPLAPADARGVKVGRLADDDGAVARAVLGVVERREVIDDLRRAPIVNYVLPRERERTRGRRTGLLQIATSYLPQRYLTWFS